MSQALALRKTDVMNRVRFIKNCLRCVAQYVGAEVFRCRWVIYAGTMGRGFDGTIKNSKKDILPEGDFRKIVQSLLIY